MLDRTTGTAEQTPGVPHWSQRAAAEVVDLAASFYGIESADIYGRTRTAKIAEARQIVMFVLRERQRRTLFEIGAILNRDHSTVHHGIETIRKRLTVDPGINALVRRFGDTPVLIAVAPDLLDEAQYFATVELCDLAESLLMSIEGVAHSLRRAIHGTRAVLRDDRLRELIGEVAGCTTGESLERVSGDSGSRAASVKTS